MGTKWDREIQVARTSCITQQCREQGTMSMASLPNPMTTSTPSQGPGASPGQALRVATLLPRESLLHAMIWRRLLCSLLRPT